MIRDYKTIWREADWTFQARNIVQGLKQFPQNAKIVLFLRHSHRKESNNAKELDRLGLTEIGCEIAKIFGKSLPKERPLRLFHSPSPIQELSVYPKLRQIALHICYKENHLEIDSSMIRQIFHCQEHR